MLKKIFGWTAGTILCLTILASELSTGTKTALAVGVLLYWLIVRQGERQTNVVKMIAKYIDEKDVARESSYKLDLIVSPNWYEILKHFSEEAGLSTDEFHKLTFENKKLGLVDGKGLHGKGFRFVYFHDPVSGLEQVWSDFDKTFLDEPEIRGGVFGNEEGYIYTFNSKEIPEKLKGSKLFDPILINPGSIGFDTAGLVGYSEKIQDFPFGRLVEFFKDLHKNVGIWGPMYKIKTFPKEIVEVFEKYGVKYDDWDYEDYGTSVEATTGLVKSDWATEQGVEVYDQKMRSQIFSTRFMTVRINANFFRQF